MKYVNMAAIIMKCQVVHLETGITLKAPKDLIIKTGDKVLYKHKGEILTGCVQNVTKEMNDQKYLDGPDLEWCFQVLNMTSLRNLENTTMEMIKKIKHAKNRPKADLRDNLMAWLGLEDS